MSRDLDLGLVLDGETKRRKGSQEIAGIDTLGAELARLAKLPNIHPESLARELRSVRWTAPSGIEVRSIDLWLPETRPVPAFMDSEKRKLVVVSPFLDDGFVSTLAQSTAKSRDRTLVTTLSALRKLGSASRAALADFKILSLNAPDPEGDDERAISSAVPGQDDQEGETGNAAEHTGLHAKLFAAIGGSSIDIVTGSANATDRAWSARNAEAVARFTGGQSEIDGVAAIVGSAFPVAPIILDTLAETQADVDNRRLEELRLTIAELPLTLQRDAKTFTLTSERAPV
ncbi:MAG: hypothetical protein E5W02_01660, partial [Mesorhizobium sp.]